MTHIFAFLIGVITKVSKIYGSVTGEKFLLVPLSPPLNHFPTARQIALQWHQEVVLAPASLSSFFLVSRGQRTDQVNRNPELLLNPTPLSTSVPPRMSPDDATEDGDST